MEKIKVYGQLEVDDNVDISGKTKIESIKCENFNCKGKMDIENINARDVKIIISANSEIDSIIAEENIKVQKKESTSEEIEIANFILGIVKTDYDYKESISEIKLDIQRLQGKNINIEDVIAKKIIGDVVVIGKHCVIEEVEYLTSLEIAEDSIVKNSKRI